MFAETQLRKYVSFFIVLFSVTAQTDGGERKRSEDVLVNDLSEETQDKHWADNAITHTWWIPIETWRAIFSNAALTDEEKTAFLKMLEPFFLICVLHAENLPNGVTEFSDRSTIGKTLSVRYVDADEKIHRLKPLQNADVEAMLEVIAPIMANMGGAFGKNFQFFTFSDRDKQGGRLVSPYKRGQLIVELNGKSNKFERFVFECPLNSLFVPRLCPKCNRKMHVAWSVCPWDVTKLP